MGVHPILLNLKSGRPPTFLMRKIPQVYLGVPAASGFGSPLFNLIDEIALGLKE
jgi:hypothetical protein